MKRNFLIAVTVLACAVLRSAQPQPKTSEAYTYLPFDTVRAMHHVQVLASDSIEGRYSGTPGSVKAANYIATHFKSIGLEAPFGKDGYFQPFTYPEGDYKAPSFLAFHYADGKVDTAHFWRDINIYKGSGIGHITGKIVFIGYGVSAPEKGWDDYAGVDVKGCVVLAIRSTPDVKGMRWNDEGIAARKAIQAKKHGAIGFLQIDTDPIRMPAIDGALMQPDFPVFNLSKKFADTLLVRETGHTSDEYRKDIAKGNFHLACNATAEIMISGKYYPKRPMMNVAGLLPASDPKNRNDLIVLGGHYDHHGIDPAGNVYHGGNDNASGAATVMELARMFAASGKHYNRSILFLNFTGEEEGLIGSKEFVKELATNGYHVSAMINMDVVGTGGDTLGIGGIAEWPEIGVTINDSLPEAVRKKLVYWRLYPGSDHTSFDEEGIPAFVVGTIGGEYPTYHTPDDTAGTVIPLSLLKVGDLIYRMTETAANLPDMCMKNEFDQIPPNYDALRTEYQFIHKTGTVNLTHTDAFDNRFWTENRFRTEKKMRGIRPFRPIDIIDIPAYDKFTHSQALDIFIAQSEDRRFEAEGNHIPILVDSVRSDFPRIDAYRGLMFATTFESLSGIGFTGTQALQRLGLTFAIFNLDRVGVLNSRGTLSKEPYLFTEGITKVIPIFLTHTANTLEKVLPANQKPKFVPNCIIDLPLRTLDSSLVTRYSDLAGLILFDGNLSDTIGKMDPKKIARSVKTILNMKGAKKVVLGLGMCDQRAEIIRDCWSIGISNYDLQNLLYFNFKNFMDQTYPPAPPVMRHY